MFTGIVEETGKIKDIVRSGSSSKIRIACSKVVTGSAVGDSIAVNGVCLTATAITDTYFDADISYETIEKTSLKSAVSGMIVNLERALTLSSRLGGHLVQGHVDTTATVGSVSMRDGSWVLKIIYPEQVDKYIVQKGSVCLDGISLTVAGIKDKTFEVAVIPHTFENTNLKYKKPGDIINLEIDQIARYIEKLLKGEKKDGNIAYLSSLLYR